MTNLMHTRAEGRCCLTGNPHAAQRLARRALKIYQFALRRATQTGEKKMAMRFVVQAECDRMNRRNRNVSYRSSFPEDRFWRDIRTGDFLITGGEQMERSQAVLSYVRTILSSSKRTIIILDGTGGLESSLISMYSGTPKTGRGTLYVYSPTHKGYDVFGGMDPYTVLQFLTEVTARQPRGSEISPAYMEAVLAVVKTVTSLTMENIRKLLTKKDDEILQIARRAGIAQHYIDVLANPGSNGQNFRAFFPNLELVFSNIWSRNTAEGHNIVRDISAGGVIYINAQSKRPELFYKYFGIVLDYIGASQYSRFDTIFYEISLRSSYGLLEHIEGAMQRTNETIGICSGNIAPVVQQCPFVVDIPIHILYTRGGTMLPTAIVQKYGTYDFCFPKRVFRDGMLPSLFNWEIGMAKRDRIMPQDMNEQGVSKLMKGHNGEEIVLVRG